MANTRRAYLDGYWDGAEFGSETQATAPDGGLCLGCANGRDPQPAPAREPQGGNWESGAWVPCDHPNGTYPDGSCVDCGYC